MFNALDNAGVVEGPRDRPFPLEGLDLPGDPAELGVQHLDGEGLVGGVDGAVDAAGAAVLDLLRDPIALQHGSDHQVAPLSTGIGLDRRVVQTAVLLPPARMGSKD